MAVLPTSPLTSTFRNPSPTDTRTYGYLGVAGVTLGPGETWVGYGDPIAVVSRPGGSRGRTQREAFIANYGDGLDSGIRQKVEKARRAVGLSEGEDAASQAALAQALANSAQHSLALLALYRLRDERPDLFS